MGRGRKRHWVNPPAPASSSYLGCLMGTSNTSSGGIWKSSGSLPLAWSRSGRTSKRPLGGFQPCCTQICNQKCPGHATATAALPQTLQTLGQCEEGAEILVQAGQQHLPLEALGHVVLTHRELPEGTS